MWWGILCPPSPIRGGGWGRRGWWGGIVVVGWHGDGRAGAATLTSRPCAVSPFRPLSGPVEWRRVVRAVMARLRIRSSPSHCPRFLLVLWGRGSVEGGVCYEWRWCVLPRVWDCVLFRLFSSPLPPFRLCVRCHNIVGLVSRLCGGAVSLWNGGDGLCGGRKSGV